jgi:hypothetical protein
MPARSAAVIEPRLSPRAAARSRKVAAAGAGRTLVFDQPLQVHWLLDLLATVPALHVAGQFGHAVDEAHAVLVGQHVRRAPHRGARYRIVVEVEADVRRLVHRHDRALAHRERMLGLRQQLFALGLEGLAHARVGVLAPATIGGRAQSGSLRLAPLGGNK